MRRSHSFSMVPALVLPLLAAACGGGESTASAAAATAEPRLDVAAVAARTADLESTLQISGSLVPRTRVAVHAKLPGTLAGVAVQIGDRVRAGQVIATIDRREIDAQVDAAEAAVNVARAGVDAAAASLANAALEHGRTTNLFEKGAVPRQRLDGAETAHRAAAAQRDLAKANLAQAEAALRRAREVRRDATLTSPIDGVVVERNYDPGSLVSPGSERPIVAVADLRTMKLEAGVSELDAGKLRGTAQIYQACCRALGLPGHLHRQFEYVGHHLAPGGAARGGRGAGSRGRAPSTSPPTTKRASSGTAVSAATTGSRTWRRASGGSCRTSG